MTQLNLSEPERRDADLLAPDHRDEEGRGRKGFTLIELLMVVVIISILAAIAIPKFTSTKEKAFVSRMKADLRNLAMAQEAYQADNNGAYYGGSIPSGSLVYNPSAGVQINMVVANNTGWAATAAFPGATPRTCSMFTGAVPPPPPASLEGVVACTP